MLAQHDSICRTVFLRFKQIFPFSKTRDTSLPRKPEKKKKTTQKTHNLVPKVIWFSSPPKKKEKQLTRNSRQKKKPEVQFSGLFLFLITTYKNVICATNAADRVQKEVSTLTKTSTRCSKNA